MFLVAKVCIQAQGAVIDKTQICKMLRFFSLCDNDTEDDDDEDEPILLILLASYSEHLNFPTKRWFPNSREKTTLVMNRM